MTLVGRSSAQRLILLDRDERFAAAAAWDLERDGYAVSRFGEVGDAVYAMRSGHWDAAVVDLTTCGIAGDGLCRALRREPKTRDLAIVVLTAAGAESAGVAALEVGADDAMTKPLSLWELSARIAAVLRRRSDPDSFHHDYGRLRIDARTRSVTVDAREVKLGRKEFDLLVFLARNANAVSSRARILNDIWGLPVDAETRTLDAHVKNLRRKIGKEWITTIVGCGYRFEPAATAAHRAGW